MEIMRSFAFWRLFTITCKVLSCFCTNTSHLSRTSKWDNRKTNISSRFFSRQISSRASGPASDMKGKSRQKGGEKFYAEGWWQGCAIFKWQKRKRIFIAFNLVSYPILMFDGRPRHFLFAFCLSSLTISTMQYRYHIKHKWRERIVELPAAGDLTFSRPCLESERNRGKQHKLTNFVSWSTY